LSSGCVLVVGVRCCPRGYVWLRVCV
jgi:hypothetical protein